MKEKGNPLFKNNTKNLMQLLSFKGDFDIHTLKERNPKMYKEIMGESK